MANASTPSCFFKRLLATTRALPKRVSFWIWLGLGLLTFCSLVRSEVVELRIESWRKDDQVFWEQRILPVFHKQHPDIHVTFSPEDALDYDRLL